MKPPSLILNLQALQTQLHGERGIARYSASLTRAFLDVKDLVRRLMLNPLNPMPDRLNPRIQMSPLLEWQTSESLRRAVEEGPSVYYSLSPMDTQIVFCHQLLPASLPVAATLYDLIPLLHPQKYLLDYTVRTRYMRQLEMVRRVDLLCAISESARQDAVEYLNMDPERIITVGTGIDDAFKPLLDGEALNTGPAASLGLHGPYIMSVLGDDPRKNLEGLLQSMCCLSKDLVASFQLLIVGSYSEAAQRRYRSLPGAELLAERLVFSGRIPDAWLKALYCGASLHVFPSYYEGFGLPAAEAAACGCASITSNTSSLPEVINFPEATFNPECPEEMGALIERCLSDDVFRKMIVEAGIKGAREHTWARVAQRTVQGLEKATARGFLEKAAYVCRRRKPNIAMVGPLPPAHSGIANYNERICNRLQEKVRLTVYTSHKDSGVPASLVKCRVFRGRSLSDLMDPYAYDALLYTMGNSEHHIETFELCREFPGWLWLHEARFYGLWSSAARMQMSETVSSGQLMSAIREQYGRRTPLIRDSSEACNPHFLRAHDMGLAYEIVAKAKGIILHSEHCRQCLKNDLPPGMSMPPIQRIPLAFPDVLSPVTRTFSEPWIIAHFGIVDAVKHPDLLIEAFSMLNTTHLRLVFVGFVDPEDRRRLEQYAACLGCKDRVHFTGNVSDEVYQHWLLKADLAVQLRLYSNGESSAGIHDAMAAGTPVITNMQFSKDWPDDVISRVPLLPEASKLAVVMERHLDADVLSGLSRAALDFAEKYNVDYVVDRLLEAVL